MDAQTIQDAAVISIMVTSGLSFVAGWRSRARVERKVCEEQYRALFLACKSVFVDPQGPEASVEAIHTEMEFTFARPPLLGAAPAMVRVDPIAPAPAALAPVSASVPQGVHRPGTPEETGQRLVVTCRHGDPLDDIVHELDPDDLEEVAPAEFGGLDVVADQAVTHAINVRALLASSGALGAK